MSARMGKFDRRNSQKMKRRRAQEKLKERARRERAEHAVKAAAATKKGKKLKHRSSGSTPDPLTGDLRRRARTDSSPPPTSIHRDVAAIRYTVSPTCSSPPSFTSSGHSRMIVVWYRDDHDGDCAAAVSTASAGVASAINPRSPCTRSDESNAHWPLGLPQRCEMVVL